MQKNVLSWSQAVFYPAYIHLFTLINLYNIQRTICILTTYVVSSSIPLGLLYDCFNTSFHGSTKIDLHKNVQFEFNKIIHLRAMV